MKKTQKYSAGQTLSAGDINRVFGEVERLSRVTAEFPLEARNQPGGVNLRIVPQGFWALLTAYPTPAYSGQPYPFEEVVPNGDGTFTVLSGGRFAAYQSGSIGNPAYEINGGIVSAGVYVWLAPDGWGNYLFDRTDTNAGISSSSSGGGGGGGSGGSASGNGVSLVSAVSCNGNALQVTNNTLTGTVTINGVTYNVTFNLQ